MRLRLFALIAVMLSFGISTGTFSQPEEKPVIDEFIGDSPIALYYREVAGQLRCPTCTGLSVLDSDAAFSRQIKSLVKEKVKEGRTKSEILDFFVARYGPWILRSPPKTGFNVLAWALPIAGLILGPVLLWVLIWRQKKTISTMGVRSSEEILDEMESMLTKMRQGV